MKTRRASVIMGLIMTMFASLITVSCSGDATIENSKRPQEEQLYGTWRREEPATPNKEAYWEEYYFSNSMNCTYTNSNGTKGEFTYSVSNNIISYKGTWWYPQFNWTYKSDSYYWTYRVDDDTLYLDEKVLTRKKTSVK